MNCLYQNSLRVENYFHVRASSDIRVGFFGGCCCFIFVVIVLFQFLEYANIHIFLSAHTENISHFCSISLFPFAQRLSKVKKAHPSDRQAGYFIAFQCMLQATYQHLYKPYQTVFVLKTGALHCSIYPIFKVSSLNKQMYCFALSPLSKMFGYFS